MRGAAKRNRLSGLFAVAILCSVGATGQNRIPLGTAGPSAAEEGPPSPRGTEPKPEEATKAILSAFDRYEVVAMSAAHGAKDLDDFILNLVRSAEFPNKVNDIAVECGNSLYQPLLDRYIAGDDVTLEEARPVWRNTTQPMCGVSGFYEELFPLVRRINQGLPPGKRLRVLAGDPAIDWSKIKTRHDLPQLLMERDGSIAAVMEEQVLARHRKALMLFGQAHLYHSTGDQTGQGESGRMGPTAVGIYEKEYPGVTLVVGWHEGFGNWTPLAKYNNLLEARMAGWPIPSLVVSLKGTWLADLLDKTHRPDTVEFINKRGPDGKVTHIESGPEEAGQKFTETVDAYLYLGPRDLQLSETPPAQVFLDKSYMAEMERRAALMGDLGLTDQANPAKVVDDWRPFYYDPEEMEKAMKGVKMMGPAGDGPTR